MVGLVHIKDLLPFWNDGSHFALSAVMRQVPVVPPSMRVLDLLLEMRKSHATWWRWWTSSAAPTGW
ncbi:MAG: hypothetical protein R3D25_00630 [Geminicoccaceae bacterium]